MKRHMAEMSAETLRATFSVGEHGQIYWVCDASTKIRAGRKAGTQSHKGGRIYVKFRGKSIAAHRLVWMLAYGKWPDGLIDHINGDPSDNRLENLRDANASTNSQNRRGAQKNSHCGLLGVSKHNATPRPYRARLQVGDRVIRIGGFATAEAAHAAYIEAKRAHHQGCTI